MLKRFLKWFFIVVITLLLGAGLGVFIYKDRIIQQVIVELNRQLTVPIEVSKVDIDLLHGFPNISVAFYNTKLPANTKIQILTAEKLYVIINPFALFQGELNADRLEIVNANLEIIIDENNNGE